ncbi:hypothetical protein [Acidovorax sp. BL-A-41-H1]|uniref:hypothetical protein n=1 Tax=Acidovorax sp. BL-A-41-H1 TaxID=3421102 RepID=UPI003F7B30CC
MPGAILGPVAGAVVGGLMGGDEGGSSQAQSKEPWEPARKPLINSLNTGQDLERYYQRNPFNRLQQQGYQNLFTDLDSFRNQIAPGMMQFANQMMQSDYQRGPRNSQMEAMQGGGGGYGGGMGGMQTNMKQPMMMQQGGDGVYDTKPMGMGGGGLMGAMGQASQMQRGDMSGGQSFGAGMPGGSASFDQQGLLTALGQAGMGGPFPAPSSGSYGLLDFPELNPFTSTTNGIPPTPVDTKPPEKSPDDLAREEWERRRISGEGYRGEGA